MDEGINTKLIHDAYKKPTLSAEEEKELGKRILESNGKDQDAINKLVESHLRYAISIARRFSNYGLPLGDLIQEGSCGLTIAASRFDPNKESRFSTYAQWWIKAFIAEYVLKNWSLVKIGSTRSQKTLFFNLRRLKHLHDRNNPNAIVMSDQIIEKIAKDLDVTPQDVKMMEQRLLFGRDGSLNAPIGENDQNDKESALPDERQNPATIVLENDQENLRNKLIERAMQELSEREQYIFKNRTLEDHKITLDELGKKLGISKERVRQLEIRSNKKIAHWIKSNINNGKDLF